MQIGKVTRCDLCGTVIVASPGYKPVVAPRAALRMFLELHDPDLQPTWQETGDGSGSMLFDICKDCSTQMGPTMP